MKRLNIFVDETGEFAFGKDASKLYGVVFVFHEQVFKIKNEINNLNARLNKIGYSNMIHMADLIMHKGDYTNFPIEKRKSIFNAIYEFSKRIPVKYHSIFIDKKYTNNSGILRTKLTSEINTMLKNNENYFKKFDKIIMYYDNGQPSLANILDNTFSKLNGFTHIIDFNHKEKRLFQVADMLTFIDKYRYKFKNKIPFTKSEQYFFKDDEARKIIREIDKKRL